VVGWRTPQPGDTIHQGQHNTLWNHPTENPNRLKRKRAPNFKAFIYDIWVFPKNRGKTPQKWMVKIMGKPTIFLMDALGGKPTIFGNTRLDMQKNDETNHL